MHQRHGAHRARFQGGIQRSADEPVVPLRGASCAQREDLGMCGGIVQGDVAVPALPQQFAIAYQHSAYWNFVFGIARVRG